MENAALIASPAKGPTTALRQLIRLLLHLAALYITVYVCSPWLAGAVYNFLMPGLSVPRAGSSFQFFFSHLLAFSFIPAFLSGLVNTRYRHAVALLVWIVPTAVLVYKLGGWPSCGFRVRYHERGCPSFRAFRKLGTTNADPERLYQATRRTFGSAL